jgi:hypothetical protein
MGGISKHMQIHEAPNADMADELLNLPCLKEEYYIG